MKKADHSFSRRKFLSTLTAAFTAPLILKSSANGAKPKGAQFRQACIGVGGMGANDREH